MGFTVGCLLHVMWQGAETREKNMSEKTEQIF